MRTLLPDTTGIGRRPRSRMPGPRWRPVAGLIFLCAAAPVPAGAYAAPASTVLESLEFNAAAAGGVPDAWQGQRDRVLELLLQDTRQLLPRAPAGETSRAEPEGGAVAVAEAVRPVSRVQLSALYGVEPHYTVVLELDGMRRTYRPGASLPLEEPDRLRAWRLLRVQERCAVLRLPAGPVRTVCHAPRDPAAAMGGGEALLLSQPLPGLSR